MESLDWPRKSLREASGRGSWLRFGDEGRQNCGVEVVFALLQNSLSDLGTFIVAVFCLIDDRIAHLGRLREGVPVPTLSDSDVVTIEAASEL